MTVIVVLVVYFVLIVSALAWWLLPGGRRRVRSALAALRHGGRSAGGGVAASARAQSQRGAAVLREGVTQAAGGLRAQALLWGVLASVLVVVPAAALLLRHAQPFDSFDPTASRDVDPRVAALLAGEQLVPPPPLPPELFLAREVEQARPLAAGANRKWELIDADFRQRLLATFKVMREQHGIEMVLLEGYRSPERQAELLRLGPAVTQAGPGESLHQHGLAADCAFLFDGRIVIPETDPRAARAYPQYGAVAQSFGLVWGGNWRTLKDLGHVELKRAARSSAPTPPDPQRR